MAGPLPAVNEGRHCPQGRDEFQQTWGSGWHTYGAGHAGEREVDDGEEGGEMGSNCRMQEGLRAEVGL